MIARYRGGQLSFQPGEGDVARSLGTLSGTVAARFDEFDLTGALEAIWEVVRALNRHVERSKPWELAKDPAAAESLDRVLFDLAEGLRIAAVALSPFVPETAGRILRALGQADDLSWAQADYGAGRQADGIEPAPPLFPRVDLPAAAA